MTAQIVSQTVQEVTRGGTVCVYRETTYADGRVTAVLIREYQQGADREHRADLLWQKVARAVDGK